MNPRLYFKQTGHSKVGETIITGSQWTPNETNKHINAGFTKRFSPDLKWRLLFLLQAKSAVSDLEGFTKLLRLSFGEVYLGVSLTVVNKDLNMASINVSNFKL